MSNPINSVLNGFSLSNIKAGKQLEILERNNLLHNMSEDDKNNKTLINDIFSKSIIDGKLNSSETDAWLAGEDNVCTDGKDDGQISFFSKAGNFFEGMAKTVVGSIKNICSDPKKAAGVVAGIAASAVLVAFGGPVGLAIVSILGISGAVKLISQGVQEFKQASEIAKNAETDAEAKAAYEQMGSGTLQVGVGVYCGVQGARGLSDACTSVVSAEAAVPAETAAAASTEAELEKFGEEFANGFADPSIYVDNAA